MKRPRLGFLGLGWIGRHRLQALAGSGVAEIVALADPDPESLSEARRLAPAAKLCADLEAVLAQEIDGLVIATPSALHAGQGIAALERDIAVFCQKPLAPTAAEVQRVVASARAHDRLLGVDFSYRYLRGMRRIKEQVKNGDFGRIYALSLIFHNAYGPDKEWFYRRDSAGGGCVIDLGIHLIDLALWLFDFPAVKNVFSRCYAGGHLLEAGSESVEDYASVSLDLDNSVSVDLACSWRLPVGRDADIQAALYGTSAGAALKNIGGSFYDFRTELYRGTSRDVLYEPAQEGEWGGRAAIDWARRLAANSQFDEDALNTLTVAETIDSIYTRNGF